MRISEADHLIYSMKYNLNNKQFITVGNEHGLSSAETVFRYFQSGEVITGEYQGGEIIEGHFVGKFTSSNRASISLCDKNIRTAFRKILGPYQHERR